MEENKITIPKELQDICREFAEIARKHDLNHLHLTFSTPFQNPWQADITMQWESGRHGDASNRLYIRSEHRVHTTVTLKEDASN
jgi:hypothetical protein